MPPQAPCTGIAEGRRTFHCQHRIRGSGTQVGTRTRSSHFPRTHHRRRSPPASNVRGMSSRLRSWSPPVPTRARSPSPARGLEGMKCCRTERAPSGQRTGKTCIFRPKGTSRVRGRRWRNPETDSARPRTPQDRHIGRTGCRTLPLRMNRGRSRRRRHAPEQYRPGCSDPCRSPRHPGWAEVPVAKPAQAEARDRC